MVQQYGPLKATQQGTASQSQIEPTAAGIDPLRPPAALPW